MIRVESNGSYWLLDDVEMKYCRFPKEEKPREHQDDPVLVDGIWHPMCWFDIENRVESVGVVPWLVIDLGVIGKISAPYARVLEGA